MNQRLWHITVLLLTSLMVSTAFAKIHENQRHPVQDSTAKAPVGDAKYWRTWHSAFFKRNWGVEVIGIKTVASGQMLRFSYRILDSKKALPLQDKKQHPYVIDQTSGIRLAVPAMENIGELRQSSTPIENRNYFIIFGNPGKLVKKNDQVTVVIGNFRVENLLVE